MIKHITLLIALVGPAAAEPLADLSTASQYEDGSWRVALDAERDWTDSVKFFIKPTELTALKLEWQLDENTIYYVDVGQLSSYGADSEYWQYVDWRLPKTVLEAYPDSSFVLSWQSSQLDEQPILQVESAPETNALP
ncbi:MAG: hypothetical protein HWE20_00555 [Gammaproteobacteria bacterium]|nr:hypothetical protein [Gammaproteobacteria bacterium]